MENPYEEVHWGSFTKQWKNRKPEYKKYDTLEKFADFIIENPSKFNKISKQRSHFYKNLIQRESGNHERKDKKSLRGGNLFSVVDLITQAYLHKNEILEAQVYFAIIDFILKALLSWLKSESPSRLDRVEPLPFPTEYPDTPKKILDLIQKILLWATNNNFAIPHNVYLNILKGITKISSNVGTLIYNKVFSRDAQDPVNGNIELTNQAQNPIVGANEQGYQDAQNPVVRDIEGNGDIEQGVIEQGVGIPGPMNGEGRLTKKMMKDLRAYHRQVGGKISTKDFNLMLKESYKKPQDRDKHIGDYYIDESLSTPENVVYHNPKTGETKVAYRGTEGTLKDWGNNALYAFGLHNTSKRYKRSNDIQKQVEQKYGTENLDVLGHSQSGAYAQEIGKNAKNVIVLNPATHPGYTPKTSNATVVRSTGDAVSGLKYLNPLNWGKKKTADVEIKAETYNPVTEHMPAVLERLPEDQMLGEGRTYKQKFNKKYGFQKDKSHSLSDIAKITGYDKKHLQMIIDKGKGAYYSNPESVRPNVKSPEQWAMARLYASLDPSSKAHKIDKSHLKINKKLRKLCNCGNCPYCC